MKSYAIEEIISIVGGFFFVIAAVHFFHYPRVARAHSLVIPIYVYRCLSGCKRKSHKSHFIYESRSNGAVQVRNWINNSLYVLFGQPDWLTSTIAYIYAQKGSTVPHKTTKFWCSSSTLIGIRTRFRLAIFAQCGSIFARILKNICLTLLMLLLLLCRNDDFSNCLQQNVFARHD